MYERERERERERRQTQTHKWFSHTSCQLLARLLVEEDIFLKRLAESHKDRSRDRLSNRNPQLQSKEWAGSSGGQTEILFESFVRQSFEMSSLDRNEIPSFQLLSSHHSNPAGEKVGGHGAGGEGVRRRDTERFVPISLKDIDTNTGMELPAAPYRRTHFSPDIPYKGKVSSFDTSSVSRRRSLDNVSQKKKPWPQMTWTHNDSQNK